MNISNKQQSQHNFNNLLDVIKYFSHFHSDKVQAVSRGRASHQPQPQRQHYAPYYAQLHILSCLGLSSSSATSRVFSILFCQKKIRAVSMSCQCFYLMFKAFNEYKITL